MKEIKMQEVPAAGEQVKFKDEVYVMQGFNAQGQLVLNNSDNTLSLTLSSIHVVFVEAL